MKHFDFVIVGAGFAGSVLAERLARGLGRRVLLVDKRNHIAGNAYDHHDNAGILVHKYGPHIFHTASREVFEYLSRFTPWRNYQHRVNAWVDGQLVPIPINLDTINRLYGTNLTSLEMESFLQSRAEKVEKIATSEDVVVSKVGRELYEKFFRGYTRKQWGMDPSELDAQVTARVPTRTNRDDRYFTDAYQAMPLHGYTRMFENMLDHPNIKVLLNTDYEEIRDLITCDETIYTGPVDTYFGYRHGRLPYRCLEFQHETIDREQFQPVAVVNYPNDYLFTRITEFKHLTGQVHPRTSIVYEFPKAEGDPYYPIPRRENAEIYQKYQQLAEVEPKVHFVGRLATYRYYNMDQVVAQALTLYAKLNGVSRSDALNMDAHRGNGRPVVTLRAPVLENATPASDRAAREVEDRPAGTNGNGNGHSHGPTKDNGHEVPLRHGRRPRAARTAPVARGNGNGHSNGNGHGHPENAGNGHAATASLNGKGASPKSKATAADVANAPLPAPAKNGLEPVTK